MDNQQQNFNDLIIKEYLLGSSANSLAKKYNKNISSIVYLLRKNNINIRTISESVNYHLKENFQNQYELQLSQQDKEIIIGLLLGDGSMRIMKKGITPYYSHTDKHPEYIQYLINYFESIGIECGKMKYNIHNKCYCFQTKTYKCFNELYNLFYPNKKILPDIKLTPLILKYWYIGDGSLCKQTGTNRKKVQIDCIHRNDFILDQLRNIFGENCNYYDNWHYYISSTYTKDFLNYIGECPIECYEYKWSLEDVQRL